MYFLTKLLYKPVFIVTGYIILLTILSRSCALVGKSRIILINKAALHEYRFASNDYDLLFGLDPITLQKVIEVAAQYDNILRVVKTNISSNGKDRPELSSISYISNGLNSWKSALLNGHLPDFEANSDSDDLIIQSEFQWPDQSLRKELNDVFTELSLPNLTIRHPELVPAVLIALLDIASSYYSSLEVHYNSLANNEIDEDNNNDNVWKEDIPDEMNLEDEEVSVISPFSDANESFRDELASDLMKKFAASWAAPLGCLSTLDTVYLPSHGLISFGDQDGISGGAGSGSGGFGLFDGVWKHAGWKQMMEIQNQLRNMPELKLLVR